MTLIELLENNGPAIVAEAMQALARSHLKHYEASGSERNTQRLTRLYELLVVGVKKRTLGPMLDYARAIARERQQEGFDLQEVQTAFNVLEEGVWRYITTELNPADYPQALGLTSTVLGAGKEALAVEYVALANKRKDFQSLDLSALFKGT